MKQVWKERVRHCQLMLYLIIGGLLFFCFLDEGSFYLEPLSHLARDLGISWSDEGVKKGEDARQGEAEREESLATEESCAETAKDAENVPAEGAQKIAIEKEPVWHQVEDDYFDDALFIGDSRVVGLQDYGKMEEHATFYASTGLNIFRILSARIVAVEGQRKKISVEEALGQRQFGKIYLMVGINELDIGTVERFEQTYRDVIARIQELQPQAIIYIQSIMKVTEKRAAKGDFVTNAGITERNDAIMKIADNEKIFYLDVNEAVCDESGGMNPSYTTDGIHLKVKYIPLWRDYLKNHAILPTGD